MTKIEVKLTADYGCSCCGHSYGGNDTIELEVSAEVLEALHRIGTTKVSREAVLEAINSGEDLLQALHEKIDEACFYMVEDYWLFEADNEFLQESLASSMDNDIDEGAFTPISPEEFTEEMKSGSIEFDGLQFGYFDDIDDDFDYEDEELLEDTYSQYILNDYYDWVCKHDHDFIAERVGLDIDACHDEDTIDYTIILEPKP